MGRTPEPIGLKILKGRTTKDIAGRPIPVVPPFERGIPDCPVSWLSPGAKDVWERLRADVWMILRR